MRNYHFAVFDRFFGAHWFLTGYSCRNFSELLREGGSDSITTFIGVMRNDVNSMVFDLEQFNSAGDYYADKLINDHNWRKLMYRRHHADLPKYFAMTEHLRFLPFSDMTNAAIVKAARPVIKLQEQVRVLGVMLNGLVMDGRNHLSNKLRLELMQFFPNEKIFEKYWALLSQTTRLSFRQAKDLAIARLAKAANSLAPSQLDARLRKIYEKYCWLDYMYYGPAASFEAFQDELKQAMRANKNLFLQTEMRDLWRRQESIIEKFGFNARAKHLVKLAQTVLWQKAWRKDVEYHGFYCYEPMLREVAKRKGADDWRDLLYMFPWEFERFVLAGRPKESELRQRRVFSVLVVNGPKRMRMLTGDTARQFYHKLKLDQDFSKVNEVKGQCAYAGKARGRVRIVQVPADMVKMRQGDILVSQATSPDLLPAMKKAAAIVTNTGGLICHAAITSRELKIPCVVGTTNATLVFKDGDLVEVDAVKGVVRKTV